MSAVWIRGMRSQVNLLVMLLVAALSISGAFAQSPEAARIDSTEVAEIKTNVKGKVSLVVRNVEIAEVMEMLSRKERLNILLSNEVGGNVSVSLYDVDVDYAIRAIASAGGYEVERRDGTYFVLDREQVGKYVRSGLTAIRTFKLNYSQPTEMEGIIQNHLSTYGKITTLPDRQLLIVEDTPQFLARVENLISDLDRKPRQVLIEARILQIILDDSEAYGIDWTKFFAFDDGDGTFGVRGLSAPGATGFFFELLTPNIEIFLDTLKTRGRVRTLATPKLLTVENQEAEVLIGDRLGYRVTTTINQVTSETVEFLESGVILRVTPSVDAEGRVLVNVHPEVSTGTISDGLPNQATTEVTTKFLVDDGQTMFIGGLIRNSLTESRDGIPVLGDLPVIGNIFSNNEKIAVNTETIVLLTPHIIDRRPPTWDVREREVTDRTEKVFGNHFQRLDKKLTDLNSVPEAYPDPDAKQGPRLPPVIDEEGN